MQTTPEKGAGCEDDRRSLYLSSISQHHALTPTRPMNKPDCLSAKQLDVLMSPNQPHHARLVEVTIDLGSARTDCETFPRVEVLELNRRRVGGSCHGATQCVDLTDKVALGLTPNGGIAWHPTYGSGNESD